MRRTICLVDAVPEHTTHRKMPFAIRLSNCFAPLQAASEVGKVFDADVYEKGAQNMHKMDLDIRRAPFRRRRSPPCQLSYPGICVTGKQSRRCIRTVVHDGAREPPLLQLVGVMAFG